MTPRERQHRRRQPRPREARHRPRRDPARAVRVGRLDAPLHARPSGRCAWRGRAAGGASRCGRPVDRRRAAIAARRRCRRRCRARSGCRSPSRRTRPRPARAARAPSPTSAGRRAPCVMPTISASAACRLGIAAYGFDGELDQAAAVVERAEFDERVREAEGREHPRRRGRHERRSRPGRSRSRAGSSSGSARSVVPAQVDQEQRRARRP